MEKKEESRLKSNVISGVSSTIGAAAGVVGGSVISAEVNAAEVPEMDVEDDLEVEVVDVEPSHIDVSEDHQDEQYVIEPEPINPEPVKPENNGSNENQEHSEGQGNHGGSEELGNTEPTDDAGNEIEVLSFDTVTDNAGNQIDVAVVSASGQEIIIADVNQDGTADLMASDRNNNGQLEEDEIIDVSGEDIAMQPFEDAMDDDLWAQNDDIDYVNDANVDDYTI